MKIITGYTGEAHITSEDDAQHNIGIFGNGRYVLPIGNILSAEIRSNNIIRINSGEIIYTGRHARILTYEDIRIENGTQGTNRSDLIVARYSISETSGIERISLIVIKGTGAVAAVPLSTDMPLYQVNVQGVNIVSTVAKFEGVSNLWNLETKVNSEMAKVNTAVSAVSTKLDSSVKVIDADITNLSKSTDSRISGMNQDLSARIKIVDQGVDRVEDSFRAADVAIRKRMDSLQEQINKLKK